MHTYIWVKIPIKKNIYMGQDQILYFWTSKMKLYLVVTLCYILKFDHWIIFSHS